ncbi:protein kinase [Streptomyces sp. NBC_00059]|uniref:serine/threonine-protein kinase n=1 Tax=Streptomyces sp. NBC_00059 TaxID=2975635 RepID=UPI0022590EC4|nr:serine/threonine-protein kinase [Streptomyces sp. NBC_00059]MCX5416662.1 PQQ-binding-like beta-propeller repeat protein [Streptomyces sp. NBC_00059]
MLGPLREDSPRHIGPYTVLARLGAGGMGEVFLGLREYSGDPGGRPAPVAVKTVRRDVAQDPGFRQRFRRETEVARSVTGPALAPVLDADADADVPWLATGYVAGPTLSAAIRRSGALDEEEVRKLGAELARALETVHAAGVVHRDVKPGNVLLAADGPRLIDFGIARGAGATPLTTTSRMIGSPAFMSPEHVAGSGRVVPASDVFCLASVLCFAATGRDPFGDGPVAAVLYRVKYVEADLDGVPDALRAVLQDCLVADPAARLTPAELAARLAPEGSVRWPDPVAAHIAEYERELASVRALGGPLLPGYTPTEAATGSRATVDQLPTQGPGLPPPAAAPARRRRLLGAALAGIVLVGAATGGLLALRDGGGGGGGTGGGPDQAPRILAGVDTGGGPDGSGTVAYTRDTLPTDWAAWSGKFTGTPLGCAAGRDVVVCRLTDGSYEALSAADGKRLWEFATAEEQTEAGARISPTGQFFMPGGSTRPAVHDDTVFLASGNRLVALDAVTGKLRWDTRSGGSYMLDSAPLVADGVVFANIGDQPAGSQIAAFDITTGKERWRRPLVAEELAKAQQDDFWPLATQDGVLYIRNEAGLRALRTKDGTELGRTAGEDTHCRGALARPQAVYCSAYVEGKAILNRLEAGSLSPDGQVPIASDGVNETYLAAVDDDVFVVVNSRLPWEDDPGDPEIVLLKRDSDTVLGRYPLGRRIGSEPDNNPASAPVITEDTLLWADTTTLYSVALDGGGAPGPVRRTALKGAPGPVAEKPYDFSGWGAQMDKEILPPEVLPTGGAVHVVYHQGIVLSVPLPGPDDAS